MHDSALMSYVLFLRWLLFNPIAPRIAVKRLAYRRDRSGSMVPRSPDHRATPSSATGGCAAGRFVRHQGRPRRHVGWGTAGAVGCGLNMVQCVRLSWRPSRGLHRGGLTWRSTWPGAGSFGFFYIHGLSGRPRRFNRAVARRRLRWTEQRPPSWASVSWARR